MILLGHISNPYPLKHGICSYTLYFYLLNISYNVHLELLLLLSTKHIFFFFFAFSTELHKTYQDVQLIMHQVQTRSWECISQTSEYHLLQMKSQTSLQQNYTSQKEKKKTNTKELSYTVYDSETIILVNIICVNFAWCNTSRIIDIFSTLIKSTFSFCKNTPNECHQCE